MLLPLKMVHLSDLRGRNYFKEYSSFLSNYEKRIIKVIFWQSNGRFGTNVYCLPEEKIRNIIDKYKNKSGDYSPYKRFIFNYKDIPLDLTESEAGINNNSNVFIIITSNIGWNF